MSISRPLAWTATAAMLVCLGIAPNAAAAPAAADKAKVTAGFAFAKEQCSGCHALRPGKKSPNPQAPSFVVVAKELGFNQATLREFFRDKHDSPAEMSIELEETQADIVAAYIMSLRSSR